MPGSIVTSTSPASSSPPALRLFAVAACALAATISTLNGCGRTSIRDPLASSVASPDGVEIDEIEFWHTLPTRTVVANGDALLGLVFLATGGSSTDEPVADLVGTDYGQRLEYAKRRGWLAEDFNEAPDLAVRRGVIARALADICRVKGGVMLQLLGPTERYAARELEYLGILPPGSPNQVVAGGEFIGLISQAQDYVNFKQFGPLPGVKATLMPTPPTPDPTPDTTGPAGPSPDANPPTPIESLTPELNGPEPEPADPPKRAWKEWPPKEPSGEPPGEPSGDPPAKPDAPKPPEQPPERR